MPEKRTMRRAQRDKAEGKAPSTQAGEFVREEIEHVREGKHGAAPPSGHRHRALEGPSRRRRPPAARAGEDLGETRKSAERAYERGHGAPAKRTASPRRGRATRRALEHEGHRAASTKALRQQARTAAYPPDGRGALAGGEEGLADQGARGPQGGREEGGAYARGVNARHGNFNQENPMNVGSAIARMS